jgi:histidinol-phosphate phosphatase family protein
MNKYLFLDFDGTVRETIADPTPNNPDDRRPPFKKEEVVLLDGVKETLKEWVEKGWRIIGVSNQSGVEKGEVTMEEVEQIASHTMDLLGIWFPFYFAPYKRKGTEKQLSLRKPNIGMAEQAVEDWGPIDKEKSFMVGDYITDNQFADNIGIRYMDIKDFLLGD